MDAIEEAAEGVRTLGEDKGELRRCVIVTERVHPELGNTYQWGAGPQGASSVPDCLGLLEVATIALSEVVRMTVPLVPPPGGENDV